MIVLADHNIEGQATILLGVLGAEGWLELFPLRLVTLYNNEPKGLTELLAHIRSILEFRCHI